MYLFSSLTDTFGGISCLFHSVNDNAFCVVIETNDYDIRTKNKRIGIHELFAKACESLPKGTTIEDIPLAFAKSIDVSLRESNKNPREGESTEANFAAVALSNSSVFVCTAGICRVHLIQEEQLIGVSRDHNFANDLIHDLDVNRQLNVENDSVAFLVPTRTLGSEATEKKPFETLTWKVTGDYSVLISSNEYHKFRNPVEYIMPFLSPDLIEVARTEGNDRGVLASIKKLS